ncbi:hypothetical protein BJX65DRAFT_314242 [Aspergillus insuetus]
MPELITRQTQNHLNSSSNSRKRAAAGDFQPPKDRPLKVLVTPKDYAVQHWLDNGTMPGMPNIDPFYAPYCARPMPKRSSLPHNQSLPRPKSPDSDSHEKRRIRYDSNDCVRFLTENCCFVKPTSGKLTKVSRAACKTLLKEWSGDPPTGTAFDTKKSRSTVEMLAPKSEIAIIRIIGELVVPSINNSVTLDTLAGNMDEPAMQTSLEEKKYYLPRPQPEYSVGFSPLAFTREQLLKLQPFLGGMNSTSFFRPTAETHFPFMVSEVKSKTAGLYVAENQSMHSMALCLRGLVDLFRLAKREQELHRTILGFFIMHNGNEVRIYGYYPVIRESAITYQAHEISCFLLNSETRWNSYKFVMAVYHNWAPLHLKRICIAIERLPESTRASKQAQSQESGDLSNYEMSRELAGSAEWGSPSRRGSQAVSSCQDGSADIASSQR